MTELSTAAMPMRIKQVQFYKADASTPGFQPGTGRPPPARERRRDSGGRSCGSRWTWESRSAGWCTFTSSPIPKPSPTVLRQRRRPRPIRSPQAWSILVRSPLRSSTPVRFPGSVPDPGAALPAPVPDPAAAPPAGEAPAGEAPASAAPAGDSGSRGCCPSGHAEAAPASSNKNP